MLLTAENLSEIKFKTKRVKLEKADCEINVALIPASLVQEGQEIKDLEEPEEKSTKLNDYGLKILMASVVDDNNKPVFTTQESFESLPLAVQKEIIKNVWDYNGLSAQGIKEIEKN
ncbi:MAG: hypothetical protein JW837_18190 [Sedimentisphaerales bacterium]|nr:hypothetical protein [Sedimentisphaerales bacterium]